MKVKYTLLLVALMPSITFAGFGALPVPGLGGGGAAPAAESSGVSSDAMQEELVKNYVSAAGSINDAQVLLLEAYGKKELAAKLQTANEGFKSSAKPSKQELEKNKELSDEANDAIVNLVEGKAELSAEGKAYYQQAIPHMVRGSVGIAKLGQSAGEFGSKAKDEIKAAGAMGVVKAKKKLETGLFVAQKTPSLISSTTKTTSMLVSYGKKNKILDPEKEYESELEAANGPA